MFFCKVYFRPFPPQSDARAFLLVNNMKPKKLTFGVGVNDADYLVEKYEMIDCADGKRKRRRIWACPYYIVWKSMLMRCYSARYQERRPTYSGCTVSEEWLTFSNFRDWMKKQNFEGMHLDKDILFEGNKVYSADTCVFVSGSLNNFTTDRGNDRGKWLIGVYWHKPTEKFQARCCNPFTKKREHLGYFDSEQEAHNAWAKRKLELAKELAAIQADPGIAKALIDRYSQYHV